MDSLTTLTCEIDPCLDDPKACEDEPEFDQEGDAFLKRSYTDGSGKVMWSYTYFEGSLDIQGSPVRPGGPRKLVLQIPDLVGVALYKNLEFFSRPYPPGLKILKGDGKSTLVAKGAYE